MVWVVALLALICSALAGNPAGEGRKALPGNVNQVGFHSIANLLGTRIGVVLELGLFYEQNKNNEGSGDWPKTLFAYEREGGGMAAGKKKGSASRSGNKSLSNAKRAKQDEFYTQLDDISNELRHYKAQLRGKTVLCNCDDPFESNFFKYFALNFNELRLKKLIVTSYAKSTIAGKYLPLLEMQGLKPEGKEPYAVEITHVPDQNNDGAIELADVEYLLKHDGNVSHTLNSDTDYGAGDFRSAECVEYLKQADVVVTNPPFSLFREFVAQLIEHRKQFLIVGNQNQVATDEIAQLLTEGKMWQGNYTGDMAFRVPSYYEPRETRFWVDADGQKWRSLGTGCWYTNLDFPKRHEKLTLFKAYNPVQYPTYVNYDAIEVGRYTDVPFDFSGKMGLPITALARLSPDQFDIIGFSGTLARPMNEVVEGQSGAGRFYLDLGNGEYKRMYDRVVVRIKRT